MGYQILIQRFPKRSLFESTRPYQFLGMGKSAGLALSRNSCGFGMPDTDPRRVFNEYALQLGSLPMIHWKKVFSTFKIFIGEFVPFLLENSKMHDCLDQAESVERLILLNQFLSPKHCIIFDSPKIKVYTINIF